MKSSRYFFHTKDAYTISPSYYHIFLIAPNKHVQCTSDTSLYTQITDKINDRAGSQYTYDRTWVEDTDRQFEQAMEMLESDLIAARTSLDKESIRQAHVSLATAYHQRGHVLEAFRHHVKSRDYTTNAEHMVDMCLKYVFIYMYKYQYWPYLACMYCILLVRQYKCMMMEALNTLKP